MTVERIEGVDGSVIEIRNQPGESSAVMTATDAGGNEFAFDMVRSGDSYILWDAFRLDGTGAVLPLTPLEAMGLTNELFGPVGGASNVFGHGGTTVITPHDFNLPLIYVLPMADNSGRPGIGHNNPPPDQQLGPEDYQTGQGGPDGPQTPRPPVGTVVVGSLAYIAQHGLPSKDDVIANPLLLPSQIHDGSQGKHIPGHQSYQVGRSTLLPNVSPSELLRAARNREVPLIGRGSRGDPIFDFGRPIGMSGGSQTTYGTVHFSKRGAHIVPVQKVRP